MNVLYSDNEMDLKLWCDNRIEFQLFTVPKTFLLDWQLSVACFYPTTATDYHSKTRGMSVGLPVAVNIYIFGYLWFVSISFVWNIWVQYATETLSGQQVEFVS